MKYVIFEIPPSNNRYIGRNQVWQYRAEKKRWRILVQAAVGRNRPHIPLKRAVVTLTYYFPTRGRRDPDNYSGKMILDGLTAAGVIADDSFSNIELLLRGNYDRQNPRTEIIVEARHDRETNAD